MTRDGIEVSIWWRGKRADERSVVGNGRYMTGGIYETRNDLRDIRSLGNAFVSV